MAKNIKDLTGETFGRLTAIKYVGRRSGASFWKCDCICGNTTTLSVSNFKYGSQKSCGCLRKERAASRKLPMEEKKRRRAAAAAEKSKTPTRRAQKRDAQLRYRITDKAALSQFHRWAKKQKKPVDITDENLLALRALPCHRCAHEIPRTGVCFSLINPRGPITLNNVLPTCGFCKLIPSSDKFDPISFSKKLLRRHWKRTPAAAMAKQKARKAVGKYECAKCLNLFSENKMQLDHINPVVDVAEGFDTLDTFALRLLCPESNLQYLCVPCHLSKTVEENRLREKKRKS